MKKLVLAVAVVGMFAIGNNAQAYYGYGMAGCGWGSYYWDYYGWTQVLASTTNSLASNQAFGISSGTSGCYQPSVRAETEKQMFVTENFENLTIEMAKGQGEYLDSLASLMGCDAAKLGAHTKSNFDSLVSDNAQGLYENVKASAAVLGCAG